MYIFNNIAYNQSSHRYLHIFKSLIVAFSFKLIPLFYNSFLRINIAALKNTDFTQLLNKYFNTSQKFLWKFYQI